MDAGIRRVYHGSGSVSSERASSGLPRSATATGALLLLGQLACGAPEPPPAPPELVLLISVDTLRADRLGCYGYERRTSPFLDRFAAGSTRFERAISTSSWTLPSHASLMLSAYPHEHGVEDVQKRIAEGARTLATVLSENGFRTGGFFASTLLSDRHGFEQGFETYERPRSKTLKTRGADVSRAALEWLDRAPGPAFLFLHYYDVHAPYDQSLGPKKSFASSLGASFEGSYYEVVANVASRWLDEHGVDSSGIDWADRRRGHALAMARLRAHSSDPALALDFEDHLALNRGLSPEEQASISALYDDGVAAMDRILSRLFSALDDRGRLNRAMVWIVSDHGEMLYDHRGFRDHAVYLNQAILQVPMIVRLPGQREGRTVELPVASLVDVMPTILAAVGAEVEGTGRNLMPLLLGRDLDSNRALVATVRSDRSHRRAILKWPWKAMVDDRDNEPSVLFQLERDPNERDNLADRRKDLLDEMVAELDLTAGQQPVAAAESEPSAAAAAELRALGYIQ